MRTSVPVDDSLHCVEGVEFGDLDVLSVAATVLELSTRLNGYARCSRSERPGRCPGQIDSLVKMPIDVQHRFHRANGVCAIKGDHEAPHHGHRRGRSRGRSLGRTRRDGRRTRSGAGSDPSAMDGQRPVLRGCTRRLRGVQSALAGHDPSCLAATGPRPPAGGGVEIRRETAAGRDRYPDLLRSPHVTHDLPACCGPPCVCRTPRPGQPRRRSRGYRRTDGYRRRGGRSRGPSGRRAHLGARPSTTPGPGSGRTRSPRAHVARAAAR